MVLFGVLELPIFSERLRFPHSQDGETLWFWLLRALNPRTREFLSFMSSSSWRRFFLNKTLIGFFFTLERMRRNLQTKVGELFWQLLYAYINEHFTGTQSCGIWKSAEFVFLNQKVVVFSHNNYVFIKESVRKIKTPVIPL